MAYHCASVNSCLRMRQLGQTTGRDGNFSAFQRRRRPIAPWGSRANQAHPLAAPGTCRPVPAGPHLPGRAALFGCAWRYCREHAGGEPARLTWRNASAALLGEGITLGDVADGWPRPLGAFSDHGSLAESPSRHPASASRLTSCAGQPHAVTLFQCPRSLAAIPSLRHPNVEPDRGASPSQPRLAGSRR